MADEMVTQRLRSLADMTDEELQSTGDTVEIQQLMDTAELKQLLDAELIDSIRHEESE